MTSMNDSSMHTSGPADIIGVPDESAKSILTYGSLIYLTSTEEDLEEYYAYSEGLTKTKVFLKTKENFEREGSNMRGLFRIYPSFYQNEYIKAKAKFQDIVAGDEEIELNKREIRAEIPKLIKSITEEVALNLDIYEKLKGTPVRYNQIIQLLHIGSQKYLSYDPESPSELESDCLKIDLKYENSEYTCFRILPSFKYQQESQGNIYHQDSVHLMSIVDSGNKTFGDPFLHASRTVGTSNRGNVNKGNLNKENLEKKEINVSHDKKTQWRVKIFSDYVSDKIGVLSIGDVIWINLSEEDKNLIVQNVDEKESMYSFKFVLCSSSDRYKKFVGNSNGMFIVESLEIAQGGLVKWNTQYKFKHLTTNKYLKVGPQPAWDIDERRDNRIYSFKLVSSDKEASKFSFEILYSTISSRNKQFFMKYVPKDAYFKLRPRLKQNLEDDMWVTYRDVPRDYLESKEQYNEDFVTLPLIGKTKDNNVFHCSRATQNEVIITMFLISCKSTIKNTLKYLAPEFMSYSDSDLQQLQLKHKVVTYKLERMKSCLKQLELFCGNKLLDYLSVDQMYGQTNQFIQNILKEQSFIELIAYNLLTCFPNHHYLKELQASEISRNKRQNKAVGNPFHDGSHSPAITYGEEDVYKQRMAADGSSNQNARETFVSELREDINHKKKRICELSYKLVIAICDKNIPNKNYAFQYLPIFQMQANYMSYAIDCVNIILKDNEELLLNLHKNDPNFQGHNATGEMNTNTGGLSTDISPIKKDRLEIRTVGGLGVCSVKPNMFIKGKDGMIAGARNHSFILDENVYEDAYTIYYNKMSYYIQGDLKNVLRQWNPIRFFAALLQRTEDLEKQRKLLNFFSTISLQDSEGININQEIIYKLFNNSEAELNGQLVTERSLLKIFTKEDDRLYVTVPFGKNKEKVYELKEFLDTYDSYDELNPQINYVENSSLIDEDDMKTIQTADRSNEDILTNHIDLCAALCKSRNYSWKHHFEKEISWKALQTYLLLKDIPASVKAALNRLMISLYVDQEPRRETAVPLFCKVVDKKKLVEMEKNSAGTTNELLTLATTKLDIKDILVDTDIADFKAQLLDQIQQLEGVMKEIPMELKKENMLTFGKMIEDYWGRAYNSYVLQVVQTTHLMLKFNEIKIKAKKIVMQPLPEEENMLEKSKKRFKKALPFEFVSPFKLFQKTEDKANLTEFEHIIRSLTLLLEYDKNYPEAKMMLTEIRKEKEKRRAEQENLLSAKKLFSTVQNLASGTKNLIINNKTVEKKDNKTTIQLDFLDKERTTTEIYLKQGEVMKNILENLMGQQELNIEAIIKTKILDILEYFFDYKQDKLFSNIRRVFYTMNKEAKLIAKYKDNPRDLEAVHKKINEILPYYAKYLLPRILLTGTPIDEQDTVFKSDSGEDILDINEILGYELLPVLIQQLCLNSNPVFEKKILHLMMRMYNQRQEFSDSVQHLLLLFEERNIRNYNRSKNLVQRLQKYTEESENWLSSAYINEGTLQATQDILLFFYNSLFKTNIDEDDGGEFNISKVDQVPIDKVRQDMYRHLKIYVPVISLIRDNIHIVERTKDPRITYFFRVCFGFLVGFVKENEANQLELSSSIVVFLYNMTSNLGHVRLINEIFKDNITLCTTKVGEVIDDYVRLIIANGRRAEYLGFFEIIQKVKDQMLFSNQRMVLDIFLDPKYKNALLYLNNPVVEPKSGTKDKNGSTRNLKDSQRNNSPELATPSKKVFVNTFNFETTVALKQEQAFDEPYLYHAKLFDLLGSTAIGKEGLMLNEVRLRTILDFDYLIKILLQKDNFTSDEPVQKPGAEERGGEAEILKIPVVKYIFYVYLESEKTAVEINKSQGMVRELVESEYNRIRTLNSYKDTYLTYLFDHLLQVFYLYYKQIKQTQTDEESLEMKKDYDGLIRFVELLLSYLLKFESHKISQNGKQNLLDLVEFVDMKKDLGLFSPNLDEMSLNNTTKMVPHVKVPESMKEEDILKFMWEEFVQIFIKSDALEKEIDKERKIFAKALTKIDKMFKKNNVVKDIINNEEVIKKLIYFVIESDDDEETRETVVLILEALGPSHLPHTNDELTLIRNLIENEEEDEKLQVERQNFLNRNNSVYMIFSKLSDSNLPSSDVVFRKLIEFAIKLLKGGNNEVQKSVYKHFSSFNNSETFFLKLHESFVFEIQTMKKIRENRNFKFQDSQKQQMIDILRLLQLFAEGHYSDLQNYIRHQTNSYHSYDILADISDLLNAYMQTKHTEFFDTMIQCFDTITEFIQGPCLSNQVAIIQGSFLDLASNLLSMDEVVDELLINAEKKIPNEFDLETWQLARLKYKCSITLLSLLEARKDDKNVYRMMKSLPQEVFNRNITDIYIKFKDQYKGDYSNDAFLHFNFDPDTVERLPPDTKPQDYCSLIIETGFNLYFLSNIFSEAKDSDNNGDNAEDDEEEEEEDNLVRNNIVSKWSRLFLSLIKSSVNTAKDLTNQAVAQTKKLKNTLITTKGTTELEKSVELEENMIIHKLNQERTSSWKEASAFYRKNSAHIEVLREDNQLEKTYFYIPPFCHAITKDTKNKFNNNVNRMSAKSKCLDLLKQSHDYTQMIRHEYRLQNIFNRISLLSILTKNILLWRDTAFLLAITINLLVLITYKREGNEKDYTSDLSKLIVALGCILIGLSLFIVVYFMLKTAPLLIKKAWKGTTRENVTLSAIIINTIKTVVYLFSDFYVIYYCVYGLSAIIGVTATPFFFSIHLLDVLVRFPLLQSVLKAIWIPRKPLMLTFLLFQMLNYFFTLLGYYFFSDDYGGYCDSTWICFLTAVDKSFKYDGGLGGFLFSNSDLTDSNLNHHISRFLFDNLYNLLVMIIMLNIVSGIIIDNFGTLRDDEKKFRFDIQNVCFICGIDREILEKASDAKGNAGGSGFTNHIKKDHYLWNYLFYIAYIEDKEKTEYTGLESYIADQIENEEISWFPTHRASILQGYGMSEDSNSVNEALKKVEDDQRSLMKEAVQLANSMYNMEDLVKNYVPKRTSTTGKQMTMKSSYSSQMINLIDGNASGTRPGLDSIRRRATGSIFNSEARINEDGSVKDIGGKEEEI